MLFSNQVLYLLNKSIAAQSFITQIDVLFPTFFSYCFITNSLNRIIMLKLFIKFPNSLSKLVGALPTIIILFFSSFFFVYFLKFYY